MWPAAPSPRTALGYPFGRCGFPRSASVSSVTAPTSSAWATPRNWPAPTPSVHGVATWTRSRTLTRRMRCWPSATTASPTGPAAAFAKLAEGLDVALVSRHRRPPRNRLHPGRHARLRARKSAAAAVGGCCLDTDTASLQRGHHARRRCHHFSRTRASSPPTTRCTGRNSGWPTWPNRWVFQSIWGVEHHFTDYTMCPDVLQFLTYMAGRTTDMQLGSMVLRPALARPPCGWLSRCPCWTTSAMAASSSAWAVAWPRSSTTASEWT